MPLTALIAEDEPLLAQALHAELQRAWPELQVVALADDGEAAIEQALALQPTVLFLDIRMPGCTGLEAAQAIVEDWPAEQALPLIVFVTAYDQYALQAFERCAVDYLLKPVQSERLAACCLRLQALLSARGRAEPVAQAPAEGAAPGGLPDVALLQQLRQLLGATGVPGPLGSPAPAAEPLTVIQAAVGNDVHLVPVDDVVYFEAADKYIRVLTADKEYLIRTSLRELLPRLDGQRFWQVHRSVVVQLREVAQAHRDEAGRVLLRLRRRPEKLPVSRIYAPRFKGM
jgi:DNA-binding LytR/AlgR family response regulator